MSNHLTKGQKIVEGGDISFILSKVNFSLYLTEPLSETLSPFLSFSHSPCLLSLRTSLCLCYFTPISSVTLHLPTLFCCDFPWVLDEALTRNAWSTPLLSDWLGVSGNCLSVCVGLVKMKSVPDPNPDLNHSKLITISKQMPQHSHFNRFHLSECWANYRANTCAPGGIHNHIAGGWGG